MFCDGSPIKRNVEDIIHRRCMLISVRSGTKLRGALVKNTNIPYHRNSPMPLTNDGINSKYLPALPATPLSWKGVGDRIASVDFQKVKSTWLMYDKINIFSTV